MSLERIVVGIDDSPGSCAAVDFAVELAAGLGATLIAVHAYEPLAHVTEIEPGHDLVAVRNEVAAKARREWCHPLETAGVTFETRIEEGRPADVLLDVAREVGAGLIVVGARRMGLVRTLALGSTSHRLIRDADCPVTVVHPSGE